MKLRMLGALLALGLVIFSIGCNHSRCGGLRTSNLGCCPTTSGYPRRPIISGRTTFRPPPGSVIVR